MGISSMVLGIVSVVFGLVPFCGAWAIIPAVVGLTLGVVDLVIKSRARAPRGAAIAGVILNPIAIVAVVLWTWLFVASIQPLPEDARPWQPSQFGPDPFDPPGQPLRPMRQVDSDVKMKPMHPVDPDAAPLGDPGP